MATPLPCPLCPFLRLSPRHTHQSDPGSADPRAIGMAKCICCKNFLQRFKDEAERLLPATAAVPKAAAKARVRAKAGGGAAAAAGGAAPGPAAGPGPSEPRPASAEVDEASSEEAHSDAAGPSAGPAAAAAPAPAPAPAEAQAPAVFPAPGAPALEEPVSPSEEAGAFDDGDDDLFGSSLEIQQQLQEAQAMVIAAEARAQQAEARAQQAEALCAEYEEKLTKMCDMNDKLEKDLKDIKLQLGKKQSSTASSSSMAGSSSTAPSASSSSMARGSSSTAPSAGSKLTILPQKQKATPKHPAPAIYNPIPGTTQPGSPSRGPIGQVDSDEEAEMQRLEGRGESSTLSTAASAAASDEPPAAKPSPAEPPAAKPLKRPQPNPAQAAAPPKSPRLVASAHPVKCYFDGLDLPGGEYHCHRPQIAKNMRLCCAPNCMEGPSKCSAAAFHLHCYFDYYTEKMVDLSKDWNPFRCPECDDPVQ